ncbi:uncharacterized protein N7459_000366 [Penicillium hispanicum]|uniref:uncharacterized protein n=1 Tax=Penicillium hispanicum TaxID=1080232 RepID=UPI0025411761|nr:uncharacterized protein N7459_000366 [Penicillium hispanicum]KAJ5594158.1 hypothetical protein N7459_000366 [Penicillium hispanicum]
MTSNFPPSSHFKEIIRTENEAAIRQHDEDRAPNTRQAGRRESRGRRSPTSSHKAQESSGSATKRRTHSKRAHQHLASELAG